MHCLAPNLLSELNESLNRQKGHSIGQYIRHGSCFLSWMWHWVGVDNWLPQRQQESTSEERELGQPCLEFSGSFEWLSFKTIPFKILEGMSQGKEWSILSLWWKEPLSTFKRDLCEFLQYRGFNANKHHKFFLSPEL